MMTPPASSAQLPLPSTFTSPGLTWSTHPEFSQKIESSSCTLIDPWRSDSALTPANADATDQPCVHFLFQPPHGANSDLDALWKSKIGLHLVDHRTAQTRDLADLGQPQNLKRAFIRIDCRDHGATPAKWESGVLRSVHGHDDLYSRVSACCPGRDELRRREEVMSFDVVATLEWGRRVIHSRISALSQPIFLPRNRCLRGNCPIAAMLLSTQGVRLTSLATSWAVRI